MAKPINLFIDHRLFFDIGVGDGQVGLWLVVVVVRNKVADLIFWEERLVLLVQLRRECLVRRDNQRRLINRRDYICHREGLAGAGNTE